MATVKAYIDTDVLTEARSRVRHIYDTHDNAVVAFSGGKDSLATVHLCLEEAERRDRKLVVVFRDEELIPGAVLDVIEHYRLHPRIDLRWLCVPMESHEYVLGRTIRYVQWDPDREWVRPKPPYGLVEADLGIPPGVILDQKTMDDVMITGVRGKVAIVMGIRASESLTRYRSVVNKLNENWLTGGSTSRRVVLAKPIYDWEEMDVLRFLWETGARYCRFYDSQTWAGDQLRINSALTSEASKSSLLRLRQTDPDLYARVIHIFPEAAAQERYWREVDRDALKRLHGASYGTVKAWIEANLNGRQRNSALGHLITMERMHVRYGTYPPAYAFDCAIRGEITKRLPVPMRVEVPA